MNNLPVLADRLAKLFLIYSIFIAAIVIGIPSAIVLLHSHSGRDVVSTAQPMNVIRHTAKVNQAPPPLHTLSFGWVTGNYSNVTGYNNLQVVSPLFATVSTLNPVKIETTPSLILKLHDEGKKVWGRVTMDEQTAAATQQFLGNPGKMEQTVQEIRDNAEKNHLDGINLDIENLTAEDRTAFTGFMMGLSNALKPNHITLSVDLQPEQGTPDSISSFNKMMGKYCDYIIFMGYDEHWATDPTPGPVTSLQWLRNNVQQFIKTGIPAQKLLLGLPSYTRIWQVNANGGTVLSQAVSSEDLNNLVLKEHRSEQWDPNTGAYYISYLAGGKQYEAWLTNTRSLQTYLQLIHDYRLAGYGFWNLNLMSPNDWNKLPNLG